MQDLWNFAAQLYARPGVEEACLALQEAGGDVCLLLTGAWLQRRGTPCRNDYLHALLQVAEPWQHDVVRPLRETRQQWRTAAEQDAELAALRAQLKQMELQAERLVLDRLEALATNWPCAEDGSGWLLAIAGQESAALQVLRGAIEAP